VTLLAVIFLVTVEEVDAPAESAEPVASTPQPRAPGVGRWVDQRGQVSVAGFSYRPGECSPVSR